MIPSQTFRLIYSTQKLKHKVTFCACPKTTNTKNCNEINEIKNNIFDKQCIKGVFKNNTIWIQKWWPHLRLLLFTQRYMDVYADMHVCYIHFKKAFEKRVEILQTQTRFKNNIQTLLESVRTNNSRQ